MGPKRGATRGRGRGRGRPSSRSARRSAREEDDVPEVYQDMLAEAARNPLPKPDVQNRAVKRRKLNGLSQVTDSELFQADGLQSATNGAEDISEDEATFSTTQKQTIIDDFGVSDDGSDDDFEDIDLEAEADVGRDQENIDEPLQLDLSKKPGSDDVSSIRRRKPATAVERKLRLDVHKWHILCLLAHLQRRNQWCDDEQVQSILKPLIPRKLMKLLHLDASQPQYQRNHSFITAIDEISKIWRVEWKITEQGVRRAYWKEKADDELENVDDLPDPIDQEDFREAARTKLGSRDLGAQLFCSLLRAVAVDTRLVCSLQLLPFSGVAKGPAAEKSKPQFIMASSLGLQSQWNEDGETSAASKPGLRLYGAESEKSKSTPPPKRTLKSIKDSPYPVFWVEVFNEALQKWIPVDSLVRGTINKPKTGFEPPANDPLNNMSYVIAFEDDGSAKDVTRRYVQFYNGKTRRNRVESTKGGEKWWKRTMSVFEKPFPEDRDAIEDAELLAREESEPMPKNVQDFKDHPHYALERHLRRNEVIHPKREIGKVSVGQSKEGKLEPVFRRRDVLVVKTADQWYRLGRDIKIGEQPLKRVVPQKRKGTPLEREDEEINEGAPLYAEFQTQLYVPPNVVNGKIPKNAYGNLDVYVPSMIPAGGIHVRHLDASKAARILGVDYADAVTGFEFKGSQGTAVLNGVVVAAEYRDAIVEVLEGLIYERALEITEKRSLIALQMWKKFLTALRIRERVNSKYADNEETQAGDDDEDEDSTYEEDDDHADDDGEGGGGFFPEETNAGSPTTQETIPIDFQDDFHPGSIREVETPIVIHVSPHKIPQEQPAGMKDHVQQSTISESLNLLPAQDQHDQPADQDAEGGGFILDESPIANNQHTTNLYSHPTTTTTTPPPHPSAATPTKSNPEHNTTPNPSNPENEERKEKEEEKDPPSSSSELEKGSLLSHDPEDSDLEPEWLVQAVDSD